MKQISKIFDLIKVHWGYLMVATTIGASVLAYKATIEKKAIQEYVVKQAVITQSQSIDSFLVIAPTIIKGQETIIQNIDVIVKGMTSFQNSYIQFLAENKAVSKDLYRKLTDGLKDIQDEIKKNEFQNP